MRTVHSRLAVYDMHDRASLRQRSRSLIRWIASVSAALVAGLVTWWFWQSLSYPPTDSPPREYATMKFLSQIEGIRDGELFPLPFEGMEVAGRPLAGRPNQELPISPEIYANVELKLDGKPVGSGSVILPAGQTIAVEGVIHANEQLDRNIGLGAGLGLVTRADNQRGWMVRWIKFLGDHTSNRRCEFAGKYVVPNEPGEYVLVVVSSAMMGNGDHPCLLAAEYDAIIK